MIIIVMLFILGLGCIAGFTVYNITQENKDKEYLESLSDEDRAIELERREAEKQAYTNCEFTLRDKIVVTNVSGTATWGTDSRTFYKLIWVSVDDEIITRDIDLQYGYRYNLGDIKTRQELNER